MVLGPQYGPKSLPKCPPKSLKKQSKTYRVFDRISEAIFHDFLLIFAAARPSISLLFTTLSWGSAFFVEFGKYQKNIQKKLPKWAQKPCKIVSKIDDKTTLETIPKNHEK